MPEIIPDLLKKEVYKNSRYTVEVKRSPMSVGDTKTELVWLSIKTNDRTAEHDWRDYQRIKNEILGPEEEAVEIYPAESRLVDTSNQFHLWCIKGARAPFGFPTRLVSENAADIGAQQRPWDDDARPTDCRYITLEETLAAVKEDIEKNNGTNEANELDLRAAASGESVPDGSA